ncbi:MAG: hypothetical protein ACJ74W_03900 [Pyrinomonadaceae bacterium]
MKTISRLISLALLAAAFALPVFAQDPAASPAATPNPCEEQARTDMYTDYYNSKGKKDASGNPDPAAQKHAYEVGQQYLDKYATACPDKYTESVRKFVTAYGEAKNKSDLPALVFGANPNYQQAFDTGRQILAKTPDDVSTLMILGYGGYQAQTKKNMAYNADALNYAKKAVQLIESGKTPASWAPFTNKDEALGYLYYSIAELTYKPTDPSTAPAALPYYLKAAAFESPVKKSAITYGRLGAAYQSGQYDRMQQEFNAKYGGKPETDESKFALDQLNQVIDRIIDAYARAVNLVNSDPNAKNDASLQAAKAVWMEQLTNFYKFRHDNKPDGLDTYIASVNSTPLPAPFEPKPYVPPAVPAGDTSTGDGANGTKPPATATPMTTPATTPQPKPMTPAPAAAPKPTPTPAKKPPVRNQHG